MLKRISLLCNFHVALLFLIASFFLLGASTRAEPIHIGVSIPLSGEGAIYGDEMKDFFNFANLDLANNKYKLIFEDDRCDSKGGLTVAQKLVNVDHVKYVIGFACSNTILASAKEYGRAGVIAIATYASSPQVKDAGPHVYRTCPSDAFAGKLLGEYMIASKMKTIGAISDQTDYTQDIVQAVDKTVGPQNVKIINEDYLPGTSDFRSILLRLRQKAPEALFINPQIENTFGIIINQVRQMNWSPKIYGAYWPASQTLLNREQTSIEGVEFVDTPSLRDILKDDGQKVLERFKAWGGKIRSTESNFATSYEGFRALHQAIESGQDIKTYLDSASFSGIFGQWSFDKDGEIQGLGFAIKKIEGGKPINVSFPQ